MLKLACTLFYKPDNDREFMRSLFAPVVEEMQGADKKRTVQLFTFHDETELLVTILAKYPNRKRTMKRLLSAIEAEIRFGMSKHVNQPHRIWRISNGKPKE